MKEIVQFSLLAVVVIVVLVIVAVPGWFIFKKTLRKPLTVLEGEISSIRTTTSVEGKVRRGKGTIASTTVMHLLIDGKAAWADFGEQMNVSDGDVLRVVGDPQGNGLYIMAYRNVSNGTHGPSGRDLIRLAGSYTICGIAVALAFIPDVLAVISAVLGLWLGLWFLGMSYRFRTALKTCLAGGM